MSTETELKIDWGDGVSAVDRTCRAIVMLIDGAIEDLVERGKPRADITIEADADGVTLPAYVRLKDERVFSVTFGPTVDPGELHIIGRWLEQADRSVFVPKDDVKKRRSFWDVILDRD